MSSSQILIFITSLQFSLSIFVSIPNWNENCSQKQKISFSTMDGKIARFSFRCFSLFCLMKFDFLKVIWSEASACPIFRWFENSLLIFLENFFRYSNKTKTSKVRNFLFYPLTIFASLYFCSPSSSLRIDDDKFFFPPIHRNVVDYARNCVRSFQDVDDEFFLLLLTLPNPKLPKCPRCQYVTSVTAMKNWWNRYIKWGKKKKSWILCLIVLPLEEDDEKL